MIEYLLCVIIASLSIIFIANDEHKSLGVTVFLPVAFGIGLLLFWLLKLLVWLWALIQPAFA